MSTDRPLPSHPKLPRLPTSSKIQKRPLLHAPIAPARSGASVPKVVYLSSTSPFIPAIKRVQKYLEQVEKRSMGKIDLLSDGDKAILAAVERRGEGEEVTVQGTGRAIERALQVALWFQERNEYVVRLRTGTVLTVDDVVVEPRDGGEEDVDESRIRRLSKLEVGIRLR